MSRNKKYLIAFDISDPKLLGRVSRYLEKKGQRVQYSVFLLALTPDQLKRVKKTLFNWLKMDHRIMIIPLCGNCLKQSVFLGEKTPGHLVF